MKPTAYLVNTSHGPVIDEAVLVRALKEDWIAGRALDVYEKEPLPRGSPLSDSGLEDRCHRYRTSPAPEESPGYQLIPTAAWQDEPGRR